jgi:2,4-dienoyl-CoA reductase-like NADH-dependent reductase (Old Yellow Enzyme family)
MSDATIAEVAAAWGSAARRAAQAGADVLEIHHAHGYLLHQFLSAIANRREDAYGGTLEERAGFALRVIAAVRAEWPRPRPLFLRISAHDWVEGGLTPADFVRLAPRLANAGIDLLDCSSGGIIAVPPPSDLIRPGYQVPLAERIRRETGIPTMAVGLITGAAQAEAIIAEGAADLVAVGRELLRDPH